MEANGLLDNYLHQLKLLSYLASALLLKIPEAEERTMLSHFLGRLGIQT